MIEIIIKTTEMPYNLFVPPCNRYNYYSLIINHVSF